MINRIYISAVLVLCLISLLFSCANAWDEYYKENEVILQNENIYNRSNDVDYYDYYIDNSQDSDIQLTA